jgi:hypothetical protein
MATVVMLGLMLMYFGASTVYIMPLLLLLLAHSDVVCITDHTRMNLLKVSCAL